MLADEFFRRSSRAIRELPEIAEGHDDVAQTIWRNLMSDAATLVTGALLSGAALATVAEALRTGLIKADRSDRT